MYENAEIIHLLDLCILSYQLHSQTLYWPMDPYYEQFSLASLYARDWIPKLRNRFMNKVHEVATQATYPNSAGPDSLRGDLQAQTVLDPTISDYDLINPWRPSVTRPTAEKEEWILYDAPDEITDRIASVEMVRYDPNSLVTLPPNGPIANPVITSYAIPPAARNIPRLAVAKASATDWLYCFEGGTGAILREDIKPIWSMMGFVLVKQDRTGPNNPYDVYIVFRGSRSGKLRLGKSGIWEKGNADWVTDLDSGFGRKKVAKDETISEWGKLSPGFAAVTRTVLPTVMHCLKAIQQKKHVWPRTIYVTGHSLGAAVATHFTSAVRLGKDYRPDVTKTPSMPAEIKHWPWGSMQLVTFALPAIGDEKFRTAFDLTLASRTCAIKGDVVVQRLRRYGVGHPLMIDPGGYKMPGDEPHDPMLIRKWFIRFLTKADLPISDKLTKADAHQPWATYPNFKKVLEALIPRIKLDDGRFVDKTASQVLGPRFNDRLVQYLEVLGVIAHQSDDAVIDELGKVVREIERGAYTAPNDRWKGARWDPGAQAQSAQIKDFNQIYSSLPLIYNEPFRKFVGLCLFLSVASKVSIASATSHSPGFGLGTAPFDSLPLQ